jgi:nitroimidazol reductase NimA-like FMN-containing flavoprotein (pyridoxamine 5'-phosphate oxidase superfamily)
MKNKALTSRTEMESVIRKCQFCSIAMVDGEGKPYVIPMNFGYRDGIIYLHGSKVGKKADILMMHPDVCIAFSTDHQLRYVNEDVACSWSMKYRSILAYGRVEFVEDMKEKVDCLNIIMANYSGRSFTFNDPAVREVMVLKVKADKIEGRSYGY